MKFLDYAGVQRLWAAITAKVEAEVANASAPAPGADYLVSNDRNLIVTHEFTAGVADTALAAIPGTSNVIRGFVSGEDKIDVPLALIRELNPNTTLTVGPLAADRLAQSVEADKLYYDNGGIISYCPDAESFVPILLLDGGEDGRPALAASDITLE